MLKHFRLNKHIKRYLLKFEPKINHIVTVILQKYAVKTCCLLSTHTLKLLVLTARRPWLVKIF